MIRALFLAVPLVLLSACAEGGSCPNPPECRSGKRCGCACIGRDKRCTKAIEDASFLLDAGAIDRETFEELLDDEDPSER